MYRLPAIYGKEYMMLRYILSRLLIMLPTFLIVAVLIFTIINIIPGDPAALLVGTDNVGDIEVVRENMGLNKPFSERLGTWMVNMLQGDLGDSYFLGRSVTDVIGTRIPATLSLATAALFVAVAFGIPLGILSALKPNSASDTSIMGFSLLGMSIPEFFLGLILMFVFVLNFHWFPSGGYVPMEEDFFEWQRHMTLPAFAFGLGQSAYIARLMRSSMLDVLDQDYITTARAKGQVEWAIVLKHALRNAFLPILTAIGMVYALLLGGAFITESLFRIPGAGSLIISAIQKRDYPVVQGALLIVSVSILIINLIVDVLYAFVDPRIRFDKKR